MRRIDFANCCGIDLLINFGHTSSSLDSSKYTNKQISDFIEKCREGLYSKSDKLQMIILNSEQIKNIGRRVFSELGFKFRKLGYFPGHGNTLYMLIYNPNE